MVATKKSPQKKSDTTVTRVKAVEETAKRPKATKKANTANTVTKAATVIEAIKAKRARRKENNDGNYFVGAWRELKQVRWPTRKATWSMTVALLGYTLFFVILVLVLDALFKYLFQLILG